MRRLRLKLAEYYATEGAHHAIRAETPKGSYRLELKPVAVPKTAAQKPLFGTWRVVASMAVLVLIVIAFLIWHDPTHAASDSASVKYAARDPNVHELYLQGRQLWRTRQEPNIRKAIALFEQRTQREPSYVWPYVGLADSYAMLAANSLARPSDVLPKAESAALRAIELAPDLADVHPSLGYIRYCQWDWKSAGKEYEKARRMNPALALALFRSSVVSLAFGRFEEALGYLHDAQVIDPFSPLVGGAISETYYYMRDYKHAAQAARKLAPLDASAAHFFLAKALWRLGDAKESRSEWTYVAKIPGSSFERRFHSVWLNLKDPEQGRRELEGILNDPGLDVSPWQLAEAAASFHQTEAAWKWLDQAVQLRQPEVVSVQWDPAFDELRGDQRYAQLLMRIGMKPPPRSS